MSDNNAHLPDDLTERLEAGDDAAVSEALILLARLLGGGHDYYHVLITAANMIGRDRRERPAILDELR